MVNKPKAVFLDRDGVLNKSFAGRPPNNATELVLLPGVPEAVLKLTEGGFLVFVVTNQGGVGLGYMTEEDLAEIHHKLQVEVEAAGGSFTEIRACTHKPKSGCSCRKPKPGMLLELAEKYQVDLGQSYLVGDRDVDIEAGKAAGTTTILVGSAPNTAQADYTAASLLEASELILKLP